MSTTLYVSAQKRNKQKGKTSTTQTTDSKVNYKEMGAPLPEILVFTTSGKYYTNKDFANDANLFVMLFNPTCSHCEEVTVMLQKNISLFKKTKVLMVAGGAMQPYMENFEKSFSMDQYSTLIPTMDSLHLIDKTFTYQGLPQINIYNKERKLIKTFSGETSIDMLKPYIE